MSSGFMDLWLNTGKGTRPKDVAMGGKTKNVINTYTVRKSPVLISLLQYPLSNLFFTSTNTGRHNTKITPPTWVSMVRKKTNAM